MSVVAGDDRFRECKKLQDAYLRVSMRPTTDDSCIKIRAKCRLVESRTNWRTVETVGTFVKGTLNILARTPAVSPAGEIRSSPFEFSAFAREAETPESVRVRFEN